MVLVVLVLLTLINLGIIIYIFREFHKLEDSIMESLQYFDNRIENLSLSVSDSNKKVINKINKLPKEITIKNVLSI